MVDHSELHPWERDTRNSSASRLVGNIKCLLVLDIRYKPTLVF